MTEAEAQAYLIKFRCPDCGELGTIDFSIEEGRVVGECECGGGFACSPLDTETTEAVQALSANTASPKA